MATSFNRIESINRVRLQPLLQQGCGKLLNKRLVAGAGFLFHSSRAIGGAMGATFIIHS